RSSSMISSKKKTRKLSTAKRARSLEEKTKVRRCRSAAYQKKKKIRFTYGAPLVDPFTPFRKRSKRSLIRSRPICATITWFASIQTFSIGSRSTLQAKPKPYLGGKMEIGQLPAEIMRRRIHVRFDA